MYDLIVIGAGPGGYEAAIYAAKNGLKTLLIEKEKLGGVCLNFGCIPTKALLTSSEVFKKIKNANEYGIHVGNCSIDINVMVEQSKKTIKKLEGGISFLLKKHNVETIFGYAKISKISSDFFEISCGEKIFQTKKVIIATGASFKEFPNTKFSSRIWSAKEAVEPSFIPKKIAIIGAGAIGVEFANFYSNIGANVKVFEMNNKILQGIDEEIGKNLQEYFKEIDFKLEHAIESINEFNNYVRIKYQDKAKRRFEEDFDVVIVAIGINPNTFDFKEIIETENNFIKTDDNHETSKKNLFAIGDCAQAPWLAHKATHEGIRVVRYILGEKIGKISKIPMCIYTTPQIAAIGKTEEELRAEYGENFEKEIEKKYSFFSANGKAVASNEKTGFMKIFFLKKTQEILGVHMIGSNVTELIHTFALAMNLEALPADFNNTIFPHPTLSEISKALFD